MNREEAIEILLRGAEEVSYRYRHPKEYSEALKVAVDSLKNDIKRGEWLAKGDRGQKEVYECSVCGATFVSDGIDFAYCPRCGSYMRG